MTQAHMTSTRTRVITLDPINPERSVLSEAAAVLKASELVIAPTETRYGLLALATSEVAVQQIYLAKGRGFSQPLAVFLRDCADIGKWATVVPRARALAETFLPGPLTLVLPSSAELPAPIVGSGWLGIRVSPSPVIAGLLELLDEPLTATSANLSGGTDVETAAQARDQLGQTVTIYLDGGRLDGPVSTVVRCSDDGMELLREGAISAERVQAVAEGSRG